MEKVSAVIITFNEERNIEACLAGLGFCDQVVVLDSGSTDRTVALARRLGAEVHHRPWDGYAAQRNAAHALAAGDWLLVVDADERVSPELAAEIRDILSGPPREAVGYLVRRRFYFGGKWIRHGGFHPEWVLRFFRRGRGRCPERAVHETIVVDGPIGRLAGHLDHYSYRGVGDYLERLRRYADLSAREYLKQGRTTGPGRMSFHVFFTFFQMYFLRRGFLDGYEGFLLAGLYAMYTFAKYARLRELSREDRP
ncbi:MAG: glycosyltransferase family 2 protein [Thermodesulfobacteriota bacterium]